MTAFKLAIFDCDGVLVDSERLTCQVLTECLAEQGLEMNEREVLRLFVGKSIPRSIEMVSEMLGVEPSEEMWPAFAQRANARLAAEVQAVRHIDVALSQLNLPYCVASNGDFAKMNVTLGTSGLLPLFEGKMFSATQVGQGKPAPDLFLLAAKSMGFAPQDCVVIEDSPTGIQAAVAAGMTPFGYAEHMPPAILREAGAVHIFDDMALLPDLIQNYS